MKDNSILRAEASPNNLKRPSSVAGALQRQADNNFVNKNTSACFD